MQNPQIKRGANRAYVLARLRRDGRGDLIEQVEAGSLSARRALAAIRDDVGGHRRAELPVLLVDVLNHPLAPIAAGQIQIDIGPAFTALV